MLKLPFFPFVSGMLTLICWSVFIIAPLFFVRYFQHLLHVGVTVRYLFPGNFRLYPGCCTCFTVIPWVLFKSYKECYFCFSGQFGPVDFQVSSPNRPLVGCALKIRLVFKNLQSFSVYPKSGVWGIVYSVVQFSTSMCTVCNHIHTRTSWGWGQEFIHSSKRSLSQTPPSSQPPWCFQFPPCSSGQSSHSATHSCNCTHILRQSRRTQKEKKQRNFAPPSWDHSFFGRRGSFPPLGCWLLWAPQQLLCCHRGIAGDRDMREQRREKSKTSSFHYLLWAWGVTWLLSQAKTRECPWGPSTRTAQGYRLNRVQAAGMQSVAEGLTPCRWYLGFWPFPPQSSHCYLLFWILKQQVQAFCSGPSAPSVEETEWSVLLPSYLEPAQSQLVLFSDVALW